jgi:histidine decarboxylase
VPVGGERADAARARIVHLAQTLAGGRERRVGFPGADDIDYSPVWPLMEFELNNIGDPYDTPTFQHHTKELEREAVEFYADLFGAPREARWGYVTTGSTECLQYGLLRARHIYPDGVAYYSAAAHYKVGRVLADLRMQGVQVPADRYGEIDYDAFASLVRRHPGQPVIVLATAGTTMTEAVDDVARIHLVLDDLAIFDRYVHVDAALAGVPLALLDDEERPSFDFRAGADSLGFSLHKFLATRMPGGLVMARTQPQPALRWPIAYTGAADTVMTCSRNGHLAAMAWYAAQILGRDGLRDRAEQGRETAAYLVQALNNLGWPAWRHRHALTVVMDIPPASIVKNWQLPVQEGRSHYVCLPGRSIDQAEQFVSELASALRTARQPEHRATQAAA